MGQWTKVQGVWHKVYRTQQPVPGRAAQLEIIPRGQYYQFAARQVPDVSLSVPLGLVPYWTKTRGHPLPMDPEADYALIPEVMFAHIRPGKIFEWETLPTSFSSQGVAVVDVGEQRSHWGKSAAPMIQAIAEVGTRADITVVFDVEWSQRSRPNPTVRTGQRFRRGPAQENSEDECWSQSVQYVLAPAEHVPEHSSLATEPRVSAMKVSEEPVGVLVMCRSGRWVTSVMERQRSFNVEQVWTRAGRREAICPSGRKAEEGPRVRSAGADMYWTRVFHRQETYRALRAITDRQDKAVEEYTILTLYLNQTARISARRVQAVWSAFESEFSSIAEARNVDAPALILIYPDEALCTLENAFNCHPEFRERWDMKERVNQFLRSYGYARHELDTLSRTRAYALRELIDVPPRGGTQISVTQNSGCAETC